MKHRMSTLVVVSLCCLALFADQAISCPVCFGNSSSAEVEGVKWAIAFLLGVTGTVLGAVVSFVLYVRRRARVLLEEAMNMQSPVQEH